MALRNRELHARNDDVQRFCIKIETELTTELLITKTDCEC